MLKKVFFFSLLILVSCQKSDDQPLSPADELELAELEASLESFQWNLFQQVVASEDTTTNLNISPLSIAAALYMAHEGAATETRDKISTTLELPTAGLTINLGAAYENMMKELENSSSLSTENAIFWDKNRMQPNDAFLNYTSDHFQAKQFELEFQDPSALEAINDWVKSSTNDRIEKIIDQINSEEVMFLINALYFKDDWLYPFPQESTRKAKFTLATGSEVEADMMFQDINTLKYYHGDDFSSVEMPFADSYYSMVLILPRPGSNPDQLISELDDNRLSQLFEQDMEIGRIYLDVPRFEIEYKILLNEVLKDMGMELAFDPFNADFSNLGVAPEGNLYISRVNHKTFLKIDEKGAEGAAVTSVGVGVTSAPPPLRFDRPFVFLLRNRSTKTLVFAGKIEDPTVR